MTFDSKIIRNTELFIRPLLRLINIGVIISVIHSTVAAASGLPSATASLHYEEPITQNFNQGTAVPVNGSYVSAIAEFPVYQYYGALPIAIASDTIFRQAAGEESGNFSYASVQGVNNVGASDESKFIYYFEIEGPSSAANLNISGSVILEATTGTATSINENASMTISDGQPNSYTPPDYTAGLSCYGNPGSQAESCKFSQNNASIGNSYSNAISESVSDTNFIYKSSFDVGKIYEITLDSGVNIGTQSDHNVEGIAFIDAYIQIDPNTLDADFYSIDFSPGIKNLMPSDVLPFTSVPEAETWAMMLVGLWLVGATLRRRRSARVLRINFGVET